MTRGQATKLTEMADHRLLKSPVFQGVPTAQVDEFVKAVGPELAEQFADLVARRFEAHTGRYHTPVNYALANAIAAAIEANSFGYKYLGVNVADIPLIGTGESVEQVREVHFGKTMYNRDLPEALKQKGIEAGFKNGYMFANPLTALLFALKNPDIQKGHPLGILFYIGEQLCYLCLSFDGGRRGLDVDRLDPGSDWDGDVRFLVVPAPVPVPA
ncbi:MAG: hypothetical protein PHF11_06860 [Candidatus Omnitrophica bacterium]|nr:hypothetical protein [Candidatus Omnitrophota bacterium]